MLPMASSWLSSKSNFLQALRPTKSVRRACSVHWSEKLTFSRTCNTRTSCSTYVCLLFSKKKKLENFGLTAVNDADSSLDDDYLNIFLEYVPGGSVTALLRNYGAFEEPLVKNFVRQILQGLDYLHERDIIHRDIKGANILVDNKGGIKISDFGISKKVEDSKR